MGLEALDEAYGARGFMKQGVTLFLDLWISTSGFDYIFSDWTSSFDYMDWGLDLTSHDWNFGLDSSFYQSYGSDRALVNWNI